LEQIAVNQILEQLITVQLANHTSSVLVVSDVGGVFCQKITNNLVNGIITLFIQSIEHIPQNSPHIFLIIAGYCELYGIAFRHWNGLLPIVKDIIAQFCYGVKA
jgi:hypothetical protein